METLTSVGRWVIRLIKWPTRGEPSLIKNKSATYQDYQGRLRNTVAARRLHCEHRQVRTILFDTIVLKELEKPLISLSNQTIENSALSNHSIYQFSSS